MGNTETSREELVAEIKRLRRKIAEMEHGKSVNTEDGNRAIGKAFELELRVRWGEMDANGHVNNMVYQSYLDEARGDTFARAGFDLAAMREKKIGPVIYRCEIDYHKELKHPDRVLITTRVELLSESKGAVHQEIRRASDGGLVARAVFYGMFFDFAARRPIAFPDFILEGLGIPRKPSVE